MQKCPYCGHQVNSDDAFCQNCGKPLNVSNDSAKKKVDLNSIEPVERKKSNKENVSRVSRISTRSGNKATQNVEKRVESHGQNIKNSSDSSLKKQVDLNNVNSTPHVSSNKIGNSYTDKKGNSKQHVIVAVVIVALLAVAAGILVNTSYFKQQMAGSIVNKYIDTSSLATVGIDAKKSEIQIELSDKSMERVLNEIGKNIEDGDEDDEISIEKTGEEIAEKINDNPFLGGKWKIDICYEYDDQNIPLFEFQNGKEKYRIQNTEEFSELVEGGEFLGGLGAIIQAFTN